MQNRTVIAYGDPFNGLQLIGPFDNADYAVQWADKHLEDTDWWSVELRLPEEFNN